MSESSPLLRPEKKPVSDEMCDLICRVYGASDMLLDSSRSKNAAEVRAQAHWARQHLHKCKELEAGLNARAGKVLPIAGHEKHETASCEGHRQAMDPSWILNVLDDLTQFASFQKLEAIRLVLLDARNAIEEQSRS